MAKLWPTGNELPGFRVVMLAFERKGARRCTQGDGADA
jgi:hypothetical protein